MFEQSIKYPIGQQDFAKIREEGKVYVDKTGLIYDLVNRHSYIFLSRPRRFGKSLLLSTIKSYFEGEKNLFDGLNISKLEDKWTKHKVFHLQLSNVISEDTDSLKYQLELQFSLWERDLEIKNHLKDLSSRFSNLIIEAFKKSGERVVILIDEYDNPLINSIEHREVYDKNRELLKSLYSNLKTMDPYIRFSMLTGVSRFSKMTIFSGINNLYDISFDNRYSEICGFTLQEIKSTLFSGVSQLSKELKISVEETLSRLKKYYDGYHFSEKSVDIYNPFSLLICLDSKKIRPYWAETATPEFLYKQLEKATKPFKAIFNDESDIPELALSDVSFKSPVALLYQTGYLTIKGYNLKNDLYRLGIPNEEVKQGFLRPFLTDLSGIDKKVINQTVEEIRCALEEGNVELLMKQLYIFYGSIPYNVIPAVSEKYFQNVLYLLFSISNIDIIVEQATSIGRSDLVIKTTKYIYILELKFNRNAKEAIEQINLKGYALPYLNQDKTIIKLGINFSGETRNINSWETETIK